MPVHLPASLGETRLYTRRQLAAEGHDEAAVRKHLAAGNLERIRRGLYVAPVDPKRSDRDRNLLRAIGTQAQSEGPCHLAERSAALLWGLPTWRIPLNQAHLVHPSATTRTHDTRDLHRSWRPVDEKDLAVHERICTTTPARTIVDLALGCEFESAVVAAEHALHRGLLTHADLDDAITRRGRTPHIARARSVARFASTKSQSPLESRSRVFFLLHGIPQPAQQVEFRDENTGYRHGIVDFHWPGTRVIGECDGLEKWFGTSYGNEKLTYQRDQQKRVTLEDAGHVVVSWGWRDLAPEYAPFLAARLRKALGLVR